MIGSEQGYQSFVIDDDTKAEWAISKIKSAEEEKKKWTTYYNEQLEKITASADATIAYMTTLLQRYFQSVPHHVTKSGIEKYKLPSGELVFSPSTLTFSRDDEKLLSWCETNAPQYIKINKSIDWLKLKKEIEADGVLPDGVEPMESAAKFEIKPKGGV